MTNKIIFSGKVDSIMHQIKNLTEFKTLGEFYKFQNDILLGKIIADENVYTKFREKLKEQIQ